MKQSRWMHLGVSPRHLLMLRERGESWDALLSSRPEATDAELDAQAQADLEAGIIYPVGYCDNWDKLEGCKGHEKPE